MEGAGAAAGEAREDMGGRRRSEFLGGKRRIGESEVVRLERHVKLIMGYC